MVSSVRFSLHALFLMPLVLPGAGHPGEDDIGGLVLVSWQMDVS